MFKISWISQHIEWERSVITSLTAECNNYIWYETRVHSLWTDCPTSLIKSKASFTAHLFINEFSNPECVFHCHCVSLEKHFSTPSRINSKPSASYFWCSYRFLTATSVKKFLRKHGNVRSAARVRSLILKITNTVWSVLTAHKLFLDVVWTASDLTVRATTLFSIKCPPPPRSSSHYLLHIMCA